MLLKDFCTTNVASCGPQTTVLQAASLMRQRHVGDLVVVDDPQDEGIPLGIVTDRDIVVEVLGNGLDPAKTTVGSLMRKPVVIAHESEDTTQVIERMKTHGVRRLPVVAREGEVVGIITLDDLLRLSLRTRTDCSASWRRGKATSSIRIARRLEFEYEMACQALVDRAGDRRASLIGRDHRGGYTRRCRALGQNGDFDDVAAHVRPGSFR